MVDDLTANLNDPGSIRIPAKRAADVMATGGHRHGQCGLRRSRRRIGPGRLRRFLSRR